MALLPRYRSWSCRQVSMVYACSNIAKEQDRCARTPDLCRVDSRPWPASGCNVLRRTCGTIRIDCSAEPGRGTRNWLDQGQFLRACPFASAPGQRRECNWPHMPDGAARQAWPHRGRAVRVAGALVIFRTGPLHLCHYGQLPVVQAIVSGIGRRSW